MQFSFNTNKTLLKGAFNTNKWRTRMEPRRPPVCKILLPRWYRAPRLPCVLADHKTSAPCVIDAYVGLLSWLLSCGSFKLAFKLAAGASCVLPHRFFSVAMLCLKDTKTSLRVCFSYLSLSRFKPVWCFISLTVRYTL